MPSFFIPTQVGTSGGGGSEWFFGEGIPTPEIGSDGDVYLDTLTTNIYKKAGTVWAFQGNLLGQAGNDTEAPVGPLVQGLNYAKYKTGQFGLNESNGDFAPFPNSAWMKNWTYIGSDIPIEVITDFNITSGNSGYPVDELYPAADCRVLATGFINIPADGSYQFNVSFTSRSQNTCYLKIGRNEYYSTEEDNNRHRTPFLDYQSGRFRFEFGGNYNRSTSNKRIQIQYRQNESDGFINVPNSWFSNTQGTSGLIAGTVQLAWDNLDDYFKPPGSPTIGIIPNCQLNDVNEIRGTNENLFLIHWRGYLRFDVPGNYEIRATTRQGSALLIDRIDTIKNDGWDNPGNQVGLVTRFYDTGYRPFDFFFWSSVTNPRCALEWKRPGDNTFIPINSLYFFREAN